MFWGALAALVLMHGGIGSDPVPGWVRATELKPSPVPYTQLLVANEAVALDDGGWRFNQQRITQRQLLAYVRQAVRLNPRPVLLVDFSKIQDPAETRRLKIAIARAGRCTADYPTCIEGTKREYEAVLR